MDLMAEWGVVARRNILTYMRRIRGTRDNSDHRIEVENPSEGKLCEGEVVGMGSRHR